MILQDTQDTPGYSMILRILQDTQDTPEYSRILHDTQDTPGYVMDHNFN
jgi:hypothetical protein